MFRACLLVLGKNMIISIEQKPNIVIIMADDLGFNDVSFHGSFEIPTPNIDALAYNGVILNRFYTPPLCTPSRSSLMTGKYPTSLGMQHFVIPSDEPWGLGLEEKLMPQYFKEAGYSTALIGKWHLGFFQEQYTPTKRGFDSHFGYLGPYIGYYNYSLTMFDRNYTEGYDMRRNLTVADDINPKPYVTELFTNEAVKKIQSHNQTSPLFLVINHLAPHAGNENMPMEAPQDEIDKFMHIPDIKRRTLAAMISILDRGVGDVVKAIKDKGILENTIIMFYSDNGAPTYGLHSTLGSNYPLRGQKQSGWEGASRNVAVVYSPLIKNPKRVSNDFIHVSDLLVSLTSAAGIKIHNTALDGINQWPTISTGRTTTRDEIIYNIDTIFGFSALSYRGMKIVNGTLANGIYDDWLGDSGYNGTSDDPEYYAKTVLESLAGTAIETSRRKVQQLRVSKITRLRNSATVQCVYTTPRILCNLKIAPCLYDIINDPCEQNNLADVLPLKMALMKKRLDKWITKVLPTRRKPADPKCNPINFNGNWNCATYCQQPNIVIIMADDLGFNDVSFHGSLQIPTPNIDALAYNGVILNRFYTAPMCTPSRASLLTGKYPIKTGMQHFVISSDEPWGLGPNEKIMPQYFKEAGYSTALIGKWHLGFFQEQYTPTKRGFDSHFGYLGPYIDYYDYTYEETNSNFTGYDMRRNLTVADINPKPYVTELFTNEAVNLIKTHDYNTSALFLLINHLAPHSGNGGKMQAPQKEIDKFMHIPDIKRRTLAAMMSVLDRGVGDVVKAIKDKGILENTIIMFYSDNGAPSSGLHSTSGSNYPLRGQKQSGWEGASRNVAVVYSPLIKEPQRVSNEFIHLTDMLLSLTSAAGIQINSTGLDGINQWPTISERKTSQRDEFVYNIDSIFQFGAVMFNGFKIVNGSLANGEFDKWLGESGNVSDLNFHEYTELVLESVASKSIRSIQHKSQHLTVEVIKNLMELATVTCNNNLNNHPCDLRNGPCLFNIIDDPCEQNNLAQSNPSQMTIMLNKFNEWTSKVVPSRRKPLDPASNPTNFNGTWNWWQPDSSE
ncbi:unnamed protein product [Diamesa hyperborea]